MKKLKIFNGGDWDHKGGYLYVAAYSVKDAVEMICEAYRKLKGYEDRPDIRVMTVSYFQNWFIRGCWGTPMDGITVERGVWWAKGDQYGHSEKPERIYG